MEVSDNTGLVYLRARYYAPGQGRFISKDTWPGIYTRPLSLNAWSYVEGNPINRVDPSGQDPYWCDKQPNPRQCRPDYFRGLYGIGNTISYQEYVKKYLSLYRIGPGVIPGLIRLEDWVAASVPADANPGSSGESYLDFWEGGNKEFDFHTGINWGGSNRDTIPLCELGVKPLSSAGQGCIYVYPNPKTSLHTVVIHHGGETVPGEIPTDGRAYFNRILNWHIRPVSLGGSDQFDHFTVCYHFGVGLGGENEIYEGRPIRLRGCHVGGSNTGRLGIIVFGDFNSGTTAPTQTQLDGVVKIIKSLQNNGYKFTNLVPHRAFTNPEAASECPGKNFTEDFVQQLRGQTGITGTNTGVP